MQLPGSNAKRWSRAWPRDLHKRQLLKTVLGLQGRLDTAESRLVQVLANTEATTFRQQAEQRATMPGKHTDSPFVRRAGCSLHERLLRAGVRTFEFETTLLHQKVVIVDGEWSHVGSTDFDSR